MQKNQTIILVAIAIVIVGGIAGWSMFQKSGLPSGEEQTGEEETPAEAFSMSGVVSSVDVADSFLMVKPANQEGEVKVLVSETTRLLKLEFPFDPAHPPQEATFTPIQTEIEINNFQKGDNVFIKSKENIAGKTEFNNVDFIHILP